MEMRRRNGHFQAYERALQDWVMDIQTGILHGPGSRDALKAALTAGQCLASLDMPAGKESSCI